MGKWVRREDGAQEQHLGLAPKEADLQLLPEPVRIVARWIGRLLVNPAVAVTGSPLWTCARTSKTRRRGTSLPSSCPSPSSSDRIASSIRPARSSAVPSPG